MNRRSFLAALCDAFRKAFRYGRATDFVDAFDADISNARIRNFVVGRSKITRHICIALRGYRAEHTA